MFNALLLSAALSVGQTGTAPPPASDQDLVVVEETTSAPAPAADQILVPVAAFAAAPSPAPATQLPEPVQISAPLLPPPAPPAAAPAAAAAPSAPPPRWLLMKELQGTWPGGLLDSERMQVTGWIQGSFTGSTTDDNNLPEAWNYRANQALMQQAWVRVARSVVTSGTTEPTYGFQSDWIFGTDYKFTLARGVFNRQLVDNNGFPDTYGVDPVQFYGEAYYPTIARGLDVKVGRFYAPWGVESIEAVSTPFLSHSYTFDNAPPFTFTGVLGTLTLTPVWTVQAGVVAGEDIILFNTSDTPTFVGTVQWTQPSGGRNVVKLATVLNSDDYDVGGAFNNYDVVDVVWTHTFNPVLVSNVEAIYGWEKNIPDQPAPDGSTIHIGKADWAGLAQYLQYTLSARLTAQARAELFYDPQGVRTSALNIPDAPTFVTDTKGLYEALTLGLAFTPRVNKSIIIRPEVRYDYNDESKAFDGHHSLLTASTDLIVRW